MSPSLLVLFLVPLFLFSLRDRQKVKMDKGEKVLGWLNLQGHPVTAAALPQSPTIGPSEALQRNALSPYRRLRCEMTGRQDNRTWVKSQEVIVVQQLRVLAAFPQAEQTEVKVHLDHLFTCSQKTTQRKAN